MKNIRDCKDCIGFTKYYGNKDKNGKAIISRYWCSIKNGTITKFPKECMFKQLGE